MLAVGGPESGNARKAGGKSTSSFFSSHCDAHSGSEPRCASIHGSGPQSLRGAEAPVANSASYDQQ